MDHSAVRQPNIMISRIYDDRQTGLYTAKFHGQRRLLAIRQPSLITIDLPLDDRVHSSIRVLGLTLSASGMIRTCSSSVSLDGRIDSLIRPIGLLGAPGGL